MEESKRFKMYKSGKNWMVAAAAFVTVASGLGGAVLANADATPAASTTPATTTSTTTPDMFSRALAQAQQYNAQSQQNIANAINNAIANPSSITKSTATVTDPVATNTKVLTDLGFDAITVSTVASDTDEGATHAFFAKVATFSPDDQTKARAAYEFLTTQYKKDHKAGVYVTATHDGFEYSDVNLTKSEETAYNKGDVFKIVSMVRSNGKLRYQVADGNYISAYHVTVNSDFTNPTDFDAMTKATKVIKKTPKKVSASKYYYVATPKGKKHVAVVKKSLVAHATKSFDDASATKKANHIKKGTKVSFKKVVKEGSVYRLQLTNGKYVTASKAYVRVVR